MSQVIVIPGLQTQVSVITPAVTTSVVAAATPGDRVVPTALPVVVQVLPAA